MDGKKIHQYDFRTTVRYKIPHEKATRYAEKQKLLLNTSRRLLTGLGSGSGSGSGPGPISGSGPKRGRPCSTGMKQQVADAGSGSNVSFNLFATRPPTKKRSALIGVNANNQPLQKTTSTSIVTKDPLLSRLKCPSKYEGFTTKKEHLDLLDKATSVLIFEIENAKGANEMVDLSSKTFAFLDKIGVDYLDLYVLVCVLITRQYDKEALHTKKPVDAFKTKAMFDEVLSSLSQMEKSKHGVNNNVEVKEHELVAITANIKHLEEEIKKAKDKKTLCEANLAYAQAKKAAFDQFYSEQMSKFITLDAKMTEAESAIDNFEREWKETVDHLNKAKEELLNLRK